MTSVHLDPQARMLTLAWPDGQEARFPYLWLKDNDPAAFHPDTAERIGDLLSVPLDVAPTKARIDNDNLELFWPGEAAPSQIALAWLCEHAPGRALHDFADVPTHAWRQVDPAELPRASAETLIADEAALSDWMTQAKAWGLALVEGLADDPDAGIEIGRRIGFLRQTNFGLIFEVRSKPDPNNLAYTAEALPLHTDLPNQDLPPGYQFLHCLANDADGGGSVFADGVALAEALRAADPEAFALLAETPVPFRFHDRDYDIRSRKPTIVTDATGQVTEICWNAHIAGVIDLPPERIAPFYAAYRAFMALTRDPSFQVSFTLAPGQMVVFDNRRVLHGRAAFDPSTGRRHLRGFYVDRGEWDSRLRVLLRRAASKPS
ncbi:MAG: TauD/TfdA family dioxygenase [Pseudomonadota bacterium]